MFDDHFLGTTLNTRNWSTCYNWTCTNGGNNELEWYSASQVTMHNGTVALTVIPDESHGKQYLSGMLSSYGKFSFTYGYAQIVAKLPVGQGLWSSFWTLPANGTWPPEIDVLENWAQSRNVSFYIHYDSANQFDAHLVHRRFPMGPLQRVDHRGPVPARDPGRQREAPSRLHRPVPPKPGDPLG